MDRGLTWDPPYLCLTCQRWQTDEPPWDQIHTSKTGKLYVWKCPTCRTTDEKRTPMSMTKMHYEQIADVIAETVLDPDERMAVTARLGAIFIRDNPRFRLDDFAKRADALPAEESR